MPTEVSDFETQVIAQSFEKPVLVDFWAPCCGPCHMLGPVLENLAEEEADKWELAKLNTDENQEIAQRFGIMSIPAVKLFSDGEVVDEFVGALPEASVRSWLSAALPIEHQSVIDQARQALPNDQEKAIQLLASVLENEPASPAARTLFAQALVFDDPQRALEQLDGLDLSDADLFQQAESVRVLAGLSQAAAAAPEEPGKEAYVEAASLVIAKEFEEALEKLVAVVRLNRELDNQGARRTCLALFKLLGDDNELRRKYRRVLERTLF